MAGPRIAITQNDVRAIQLAKAALYAGARLLMDQLGVEAVDESGSPARSAARSTRLHAMILGLDPRLRRSTGSAPPATPPARARYRPALRARPAREIERVVRTVEKIETAVEPRFQEHFVEAMAFPHKTASSRTSRVVSCRHAARPRAAEPIARQRTTHAGARSTAGSREDTPMTDGARRRSGGRGRAARRCALARARRATPRS